ncbi:MAG TPA: hypothetical protein V6C81_24320 [Planktothrix sp.]|jgi:hypothetical protein
MTEQSKPKTKFDLHLRLMLAGFIVGTLCSVPFILQTHFALYSWLTWLVFSLASTFSFTFCGVVNDIFRRNGPWADSRFRAFAVPAFGGCLGVFFLILIAVMGFGHPVDEQIDWMQLLSNGHLPSQIGLQVSNLLQQAIGLRMTGFLVDHCFSYIFSFAGLAMLYIGLYDLLKPKWIFAAFCMGFLFLILPALAVALATADSPLTAAMMVGYASMFFFPYYIVCGLFMIFIVFCARNFRRWINLAAPERFHSEIHPDPKTSEEPPNALTALQSQLNPSQLIEQNRDEDQNADYAIDTKEGGVELGEVVQLGENTVSERKLEI